MKIKIRIELIKNIIEAEKYLEKLKEETENTKKSLELRKKELELINSSYEKAKENLKRFYDIARGKIDFIVINEEITRLKRIKRELEKEVDNLLLEKESQIISEKEFINKR